MKNRYLANLITLIAVVLLACCVMSIAEAGAAQENAIQAVDARCQKAVTDGDAIELEQTVANDVKIIPGYSDRIQNKAAFIKEYHSYS